MRTLSNLPLKYIHTYIHTYLYNYIYIYIYRKSASRFSSGTVLNTLTKTKQYFSSHNIYIYIYIYIYKTGFALFYCDKFKDFSRIQIDFSRTSNFTLTLSFPRIQNKSSFQSTCISHNVGSENFISRVLSRFPGLSRTCSLFPGLSSFSRTCSNLNISAFNKLTFLENAGQMLA